MSARCDRRRPAAAGIEAIRWIREWNLPGLVGFRLGRDGDALVAEWIGLGTLRASRSGGSHVFTPCLDSERGSKEGVRQTLVEGLLRHLRGKISLHASAASRGGMAVVILGESMAGKSTLVAELCAREGFEMLADDTVFIEERSDGFYVLPTETTHSLREDAARHFGAATRNLQKTHLPAATFASGPAKLRAFVSLIFDGCQTICPIARALHGSEMFNVLNSAFFRFVIDEDEVTRRDFSQMAALGAAVPFFELRRRPSLDLLQASARTLRTCLPQVAAQPSGRCEDA